MKKRIELCCHTHFSKGESIIFSSQLSEIMDEKGLMGIAITDFGDINAWYETYMCMRDDIENGFKLIYGIELFVIDDVHTDSENPVSFYVTVLVKDKKGRKNLFELLSLEVTKYSEEGVSDKHTRLSDLLAYREGLLIGWSCDNSYLPPDYSPEEAWHRERIESVQEILDYYEVAPSSYNPHFPLEDRGSFEITNWILQYADKGNKPVVAVSAAKYLNRENIEEWKILQYGNCCDDIVYMEQNVAVHLRSTEEMLELFAYLGEEKAREIVINNPRKIAECIELDEPLGSRKNYPYLKDGEEQLINICYERANRIYGIKLPGEVKERIEAELSVIHKYNYETIFVQMKELLDRTGVSDEPHNLGDCSDNSFISFLCGIGTVNPLKPHYRCCKCCYSDFDTDNSNVIIGYRLPERKCPICGEMLVRDGFNLPFESVFGINGGKVPFFELNVRPSRQMEIMNTVSSLSEIKMAFKALTCHTIGHSSAGKMIECYCEKYNRNLEEYEREAYLEELSACFSGYGMHSDRVFMFPEDAEDVSEYLPLYRQKSGDIVSGVEFFQIDNQLYSLSIRALNLHEMIYRLENSTGYPAEQISLTDASMFNTIPTDKCGRILLDGIPGLESDYANCIINTVMDFQGKIDFWDFVKINGMMHGMDVWFGNGEVLLKEGHRFAELISTREDCFDYFRQHGVEHKTAFLMSENIRKGKARWGGWADKWKEEIEEHNIPKWYIDSCRKIGYLFPRAHCASYAKMHWMLIYYKAHYPEIYYQTYIDVYGSQSDKKIISGGVEIIQAVIDKLRNGEGSTETDDERIERYGNDTKVLKTAIEMYERGFSYQA